MSPAVMPSSRAMNNETNVSDSVAGRRAMTASATDWLENSEVPRSPWSAFPSQSR